MYFTQINILQKLLGHAVNFSNIGYPLNLWNAPVDQLAAKRSIKKRIQRIVKKKFFLAVRRKKLVINSSM